MRTLETEQIAELVQVKDPLFEAKRLAGVRVGEDELPIYGIRIGSPDKTKPTLGLFGGVHGLERVGTEVVISYLRSVASLLKWDRHFRRLLEEVRIISIPLINPGGMAKGSRSNPNGVDLMRNCPVEAIKPTPLVGGHRIGSWLPWYRGEEGKREVEVDATIGFIRDEGFPAEFFLTADFHSGFGVRDRFWYPYAKTKTVPFPLVNQVERFINLLNDTYPHHVYIIEPQSAQYVTHGDLWDYLFDEHQKLHPSRVFLPWTLEMGSWNWVKKNPSQLFSRTGIFNPKVSHRRRRTMRRHLILFDFLLRATANYGEWVENERIDSKTL